MAAVDKSNDFFNYVYKWWYSSKNHKGRFGKITKGSGTEDTSIQQTCKAAYKESKVGVDGSKIKKYGANASINDDEFREEDIWTLCSVRGYRIRTIEEAKEESYYGEGMYGQKYKDKLVSVYASGTGGFWDFGYNWRDDVENNTNDTTAFEKVLKAKKEDDERYKTSWIRSKYSFRYNLDSNMMRVCKKHTILRKTITIRFILKIRCLNIVP